MTTTQLRALVDSIGQDKIVALVFDNSRKCHIPVESDFNTAVTLDSVHETIRVQYENIAGLKYTVAELADSLQSIIYVDSADDRKFYNKAVL